MRKVPDSFDFGFENFWIVDQKNPKSKITNPKSTHGCVGSVGFSPVFLWFIRLLFIGEYTSATPRA